MKKLIFITALLLTSLFAFTQSRGKVGKIEYSSSFNYEVSTVAVGVDGTKFIKVWGYGKKVEDAIHNAKERGVACAIFRGYPAAGGGRAGTTPAIVNDANAANKHQKYFDNFFAPGGQYLQYVNLSSDGPPSGSDRIKMKKGYKVGVTMSIAYNELRKELENKGIARKLDAGF